MRDTLQGLRETIKAKDELIVALTHQRNVAQLESAEWERIANKSTNRCRVALAALNTIEAIAEATK